LDADIALRVRPDNRAILAREQSAKASSTEANEL
jgi:hypothetical protein